MGREVVASVDQGHFGVPAVEQGLDLSVYFNVLKRRYLLIIIPALILFACVLVATFFVLPSVYEASAKILVQSQLIPKDMAASMVTASATERIQIIEQHLTTRDNLLAIARKFDLYPKQSAWASPSQLVDWIRKATTIEPMELNSKQTQNAAADALGFILSFDYSDPIVATKVANELVASILDQNIRARNARAEETSKFFDQQANKLGADLAALEQRIAEFKKANEALLPETLEVRRVRLTQLQIQLSALDGTQGVAQPGAAEITEELKSLNSKLKSVQLQLANTTDQRKNLDSLYKKGYVAKTRILDLDNRIADLQANVDSAKSLIAIAQQRLEQAGGGQPDSLPKRRADVAAQVDAVQASIAKTPEVEATLSGLNRDYANLQEQYRLAKARTTAATTGQELEQDRQAERFEVLEQAVVPDEPISPNRPRILLAGAAGSLAAGVGLVVLLEMLNKSIRSSMDLERALQIRPLVTIPYVVTAAERRKSKRQRERVVVSLVVLLALAIVLVHEFYFPLDLLATQLLRRAGLAG